MERNYQFRERMMVVHKKNRRDYDRKKADNQIEIDSTWTITIPRDYDRVIEKSCRDLEDYFFTSMKVSLKVLKKSEISCDDNSKKIIYSKSVYK